MSTILSTREREVQVSPSAVSAVTAPELTISMSSQPQQPQLLLHFSASLSQQPKTEPAASEGGRAQAGKRRAGGARQAAVQNQGVLFWRMCVCGLSCLA